MREGPRWWGTYPELKVCLPIVLLLVLVLLLLPNYEPLRGSPFPCLPLTHPRCTAVVHAWALIPACFARLASGDVAEATSVRPTASMLVLVDLDCGPCPCPCARSATRPTRDVGATSRPALHARAAWHMQAYFTTARTPRHMSARACNSCRGAPNAVRHSGGHAWRAQASWSSCAAAARTGRDKRCISSPRVGRAVHRSPVAASNLGRRRQAQPARHVQGAWARGWAIGGQEAASEQTSMLVHTVMGSQ